MRRHVRINFTDFWHPDTLEAKRNNLLYQLLSKRFDLEICDDPDFLLFSCFGVDFIRYDCTRIFYTGENVRPNYSLCDWAFSFDFSDNPRHMRLPYYFFFGLDALKQPRDADALLKTKTGFCSFVVSNEQSKPRLKFFDKLSRYKKVDSGGKARNNLGYRVPDKQAFLRNYKFNIAFENESYPGYVTEKIGEAFLAGTLPIYWGNPLIERDFNTNAFINCHDYRSMDDVVDMIVELDRNDELYRRYIDAQPLPLNNSIDYISELRLLDRFEEIFATRLQQPIAKQGRGRLANWIREPRRWRRNRRAARNAMR